MSTGPSVMSCGRFPPGTVGLFIDTLPVLIDDRAVGPWLDTVQH
jgi:hypothetical protein